ncbi:MAG TPA: GYD domain-containing protein [Rubrivivax sp.]
MPHFMVQASYGTAAIGAMVKNPQDRAAAIRPMIEKMGGKLHGLWLTFGEYDIVAIAELPDATAAASLSMAIGASGAMSSYRTTPLLTMNEAVEAMKKAGGAGYQAPK